MTAQESAAPTRSPGAGLSPGTTRVVLIVLLALVGTEFVVRGPVRWAIRGSHDRMTDLTGPYVGARAWVRGLNPYQADVFWTMSEQVGLDSDRENRPDDDFQSHSPYPLTSFVMMAPFSVLSWPAMRMFAMLAMTVLALAAIFSLGALDRLRRVPRRRYAFIAFALALAPLHTSIGAANPVAVAAPLTVLAICAALKGEQTIGGLLLAAAVCVKAPIAVPVLGYYILRGRWKVVSAATAGIVIVAGIGIVRLQIAGTPWLADYVRNNQSIVADNGGAIIKYTLTQYQFINLQYLGFVLFDDTWTANVLALATSGVLAALWLALTLSRGRSHSELLEIGALAVISLLPVYHRFYDASLLLIPLAWVFSEWDVGKPWPRRLAFAAMVAFLVPGGTIAEMLTRADRIPEWLAARWWWYALIGPHQSWALLLLASALVAAQASEWRRSTSSAA